MIRYFATPFILICFSCSTATEKHQTLNVSETRSIPASMSTENETGENTMFPELARYIQSLLPGMDEIPENRKELLQEVAAYIREKNNPMNRQTSPLFALTIAGEVILARFGRLPRPLILGWKRIRTPTRAAPKRPPLTPGLWQQLNAPDSG